MAKLKKTDITYILRKAKIFLLKENIRYVNIDIDAYKQGKGFIDFHTN